jgi:hypothetical protein
MPGANQVTLSADFEAVPAAIDFGNLSIISVLVTGTERFAILLVVDSDPFKMYQIAADLPADNWAEVLFAPDAIGVSPGWHEFAIYAIDNVGTISNRVSFEATFVAPTNTPSITAAATVTVSGTPSSSQSQTPPPSQSVDEPAAPPLPSNPPRLPIQFSFDDDKLDIFGDSGIRTSFGGYETRIRGQGSMSVTKIASNILLINFPVVAANVSLSTDVFFDELDDAPVTVVDGNVVVYSSQFALTFLGRLSGLADSFSEFWFGFEPLQYTHLFAQVHESLWYGSDSGLALSWRDVADSTKSMMVMVGLPETNSLTLAFLTSIPSEIAATNSVDFDGNITSENGGAASIVLVIDSDAKFLIVENTLGPFNFSLVPANYDVNSGSHNFTFFAVDAVGNASPPQSFATNVVAQTRSPTPPACPSGPRRRQRVVFLRRLFS